MRIKAIVNYISMVELFIINNRVTRLYNNDNYYRGDGIHVPQNSESHIKGNVIVTDNYEGTSGTTANNMYVRSNAPGMLILDGALSEGAKISLGTNADTTTPFKVTTNYNTYHSSTDPNTYFISDKDGVIVKLNNNEVYLQTSNDPVIGNNNYPYGSVCLLVS